MNWIKHEKQLINLDHVKVITLVYECVTLLMIDNSYLDLEFDDENKSLDFYLKTQKRLLS